MTRCIHARKVHEQQEDPVAAGELLDGVVLGTSVRNTIRQGDRVNSPDRHQLRLFADIVAHASSALAGVLASQFSTATVEPALQYANTRCEDGCFDIHVPRECPPLPSDVECPLPFAATSPAEEEPVYVLLWHEDGLVTGVEISSFGSDAHPAPQELTVID